MDHPRPTYCEHRYTYGETCERDPARRVVIESNHLDHRDGSRADWLCEEHATEQEAANCRLTLSIDCANAVAIQYAIAEIMRRGRKYGDVKLQVDLRWSL